jgi:predicted DNA-binding transcriptional regulator AlpA
MVNNMFDELLDCSAACKFLGGSRPINAATLWRGVRAGRFAQPIKIGVKSVRWRRSELQADLDRMAALRDSAAATPSTA